MSSSHNMANLPYQIYAQAFIVTTNYIYTFPPQKPQSIGIIWADKNLMEHFLYIRHDGVFSLAESYENRILLSY